MTIVSGPPAAGKSTLCALLATRFERGVHLDTDYFFGSIKSGYILPWLPESAGQNHVCVRAAARATVPYIEAGYEVFVDGFIRAWAVQVYLQELATTGATLHFVMLLPSVEAMTHRALTRQNTHGVPAHVYAPAHAQFVRDGYEVHRLDTSELDLAATAELLLRERATGRFRLKVDA